LGQTEESTQGIPDKSAASDEEPLQIITGIEGENVIAFDRLGKLGIRESWIDLKKGCIVPLRCNRRWREAVTSCLQRIRTKRRDAQALTAHQ